MNSGMALSLITAFMWGILPVALKRVLQHLDPVTITWVRLVFATVFVGSYYVWSGKWPAPAKFTRRNVIWLSGVAVSMAANYWLFLAGLHLVSPPVAQLTIQTGPLFLALGSWYFFSEKLRRRQLAGFAVMLLGFWFFYSGNLGAGMGPPNSAAEFRTSRSHFEEIRSFARPCTRVFCTTPSARASTWANCSSAAMAPWAYSPPSISS